MITTFTLRIFLCLLIAVFLWLLIDSFILYRKYCIFSEDKIEIVFMVFEAISILLYIYIFILTFK